MGEKWPIQKQLPVLGDIFNTLEIFMIVCSTLFQSKYVVVVDSESVSGLVVT